MQLNMLRDEKVSTLGGRTVKTMTFATVGSQHFLDTAVGELGISGVAPAIANAIYNATGIRVRDYPLTLDKHLDKLPQIA